VATEFRAGAVDGAEHRQSRGRIAMIKRQMVVVGYALALPAGAMAAAVVLAVAAGAAASAGRHLSIGTRRRPTVAAS